MDDSRRPVVLVALGAALLSTALNLGLMAREPLWWDEVASARAFVQPSLPKLLAQVRTTEATPPGWYTLAWLVHQGGQVIGRGHSATSAVTAPRILSVAFTGIATALVTCYAARWMSLPFAGTAGVITALGEQSLEHGSELRAYAMLMFSAVVFAVLLDAAARRCDGQRLVRLAVIAAVGCWTHYFFLPVLASATVWVGVTPMTRGLRVRLIGTMAAGAATLVLWAPSFLPQYRIHRHYFSDAFNVSSVIGVPSKLIAGSSAWNHVAIHGTTAPARTSLLILVLIGAWRLARRSDASLCAALAVLPIGFSGAAWAAGLHVFDTRNLVVTVPFAATCIAAAIGAIPARSVAKLTAAAAVVGLALVVVVESGDGRTRYDRAAQEASRLGWDSSQPLLVFARIYPVPLSWYLSGRPLLSRGLLTGEPCKQLVIISETAQGSAWVDSLRPRPIHIETLPWYGTQAYSPRLPGRVIIAEIPFSQAEARDGIRAGGKLRVARDGSTPCGAPIPGTSQAY